MKRVALAARSATVLLTVALAGHLPHARAQAPVLGAQRSLAHCPVATTGEFTAVLDNAAQWSATVQQGEIEALGRAVDWPRERVLVVALGTRPSLGYGVSAQRVDAGTASVWPAVRVQLTQPEAGALNAASRSRPCVVLTLSRGRWKAIRVTNAAGRTLAVAWVRRGHPRPLHSGPRAGLGPDSVAPGLSAPSSD